MRSTWLLEMAIWMLVDIWFRTWALKSLQKTTIKEPRSCNTQHTTEKLKSASTYLLEKGAKVDAGFQPLIVAAKVYSLIFCEHDNHPEFCCNHFTPEYRSE